MASTPPPPPLPLIQLCDNVTSLAVSLSLSLHFCSVTKASNITQRVRLAKPISKSRFEQ
ncbi:hypothetical protein L1049_024177 [Liquidambar formosana]|uniref:Uncharacterized protein n=1 Tax=Liquidambar formosana TaxID=63359 RepID=A0AAP0X4L1_LIQFO